MIQDGCKSNADFLCSHSRSAEIFDVTISKKYRFVATNDGKKGTYTKLDGKDREPTVKLKDHECLVGYYAAFNANLPKRGKYSIDLPKQLFGNAANETGKISKIFKNFFDLGKDQDKQKIKKSKWETLKCSSAVYFCFKIRHLFHYKFKPKVMTDKVN